VKKIIQVLLACGLVLTMLAGCGSKRYGDKSIKIPEGEALKREMGNRRTLAGMPPRENMPPDEEK